MIAFQSGALFNRTCAVGGLFIERSVTINHMPMYVHLRVCSSQELAAEMKTLSPLQFEVLGSAGMLPGLARLLLCIEYLKFYSHSLGGSRQSEGRKGVMGSCANWWSAPVVFHLLTDTFDLGLKLLIIHSIGKK